MDIHFTASPDCQLGAAIIADSLCRQGYPCRTVNDGIVVVDTPDAPLSIHVVMDDTLIDAARSASAVVVASARPARTLQNHLVRPAVAAVDAEGLAEQEGADPIVAVLGAAARLLPILNYESLAASVWAAYDRGFGYEARAALRAFDLGYKQAQVAQ
jgi:hypothetical protein